MFDFPRQNQPEKEIPQVIGQDKHHGCLLDRIAFEVVSFDAADARAAGAIRANLEAIGRPMGPLDTLIAGQSRARGLILVTANTQEFVRVEGLNCEDWSIAGEGHA